jgi:hypothetical protein
MATRHLGLEVSALRYDSLDVIQRNPATGQFTYDSDHFNTLGLSLVGALPIGNRFELIARGTTVFGASRGTGQICRRKNPGRGTGYSDVPCSERQTTFGFGFGARWAATPHLGVRIDWDANDLRVDGNSPTFRGTTLMLGVDWRFF